MNRKLVLAAIGGIAAIGLVAGGSTYSAWSDFQQVNNNKTDAGHLVLNLNGSGTISNVGATAIAPGQSRTIDQYLTSADLAGVPSAALSVTFKDMVDQENRCSSNSERAMDPNCDAVGDPGEFSSQAYVRIRYSDPQTGIVLAANGDCNPTGGYTHSYGYSPVSNNDTTVYPTLGGVQAQSPIQLGTLSAGQGICIRYDIGLPPTATNVTQGDSAIWNMQYDLAQVL